MLSLKIPGKELEKIIDKSQMAEIPLYWTDFISKDTIIDLILHAFYKFSSNFPKFLRHWIKDSEKKYTILGEQVVKQKVSNMILDYEIKQIENKEPSRVTLTQYGEAMSFLSSAIERPRKSRLHTRRRNRPC